MRKLTGKAQAAVTLEKHRRACSVCKHSKCEEIEAAFIRWDSPDKTASEHGISRDALYRHAHALELFEARGRNLRRALERIIERAADVEATASAVVAAVQAYSKINAAGEWVDRTETVSLSELFSKMTSEELDIYARTGILPAWFRAITGGATPSKPEGDSSRGK